MENDTHGFLRVAVSTASGSIPIAGARVIVRGDDGKEIVLVTDESGLTTEYEYDANGNLIGTN